MPLRRPIRPLILALCTLLAVAGCSADPAQPAPSSAATQELAVQAVNTSAESSDAESARSAELLRLTPADLHAESSWDLPRYLVQWPAVPGHDGLTRKIREQMEAWKKSYVTSMRGAERANLSAYWSATLNHEGIVGVRLTAETTAADSATESVALYGDPANPWTSKDLLRSEDRPALATMMREAAQKFTRETPDPDIPPADPSDQVFQDVSFTDAGQVQIRVRPGELASMSQGVLQFTVPEKHLSPLGEKVRAAVLAQGRENHSTPSASATPAPSAASRTNCAVAKCIALTFDDGPGPYTPQILDTLEAKKAKATFFMLGPAAQSQPDIVRRMAALGMDLGDHSWSHPQFTLLSPNEVKREVRSQADVIQRLTGRRPMGVRPPYGAFDQSTPHEGFPFILWDVDTEDWKNRDAAITTRRAVEGAHRGAIVLMHDIHPSTAKALPGIIDQLKSQGYTLVTVSDLIPQLSPGSAYYSGATGK